MFQFVSLILYIQSYIFRIVLNFSLDIAYFSFKISSFFSKIIFTNHNLVVLEFWFNEVNVNKLCIALTDFFCIQNLQSAPKKRRLWHAVYYSSDEKTYGIYSKKKAVEVDSFEND